MMALDDHGYQEIERSLAFPQVKAKDIEAFLLQSVAKEYLALIREFRQWLSTL